MSMDNIGAGIGAAALIGLRVGAEMQNRWVLQEWIDYSRQLEEHLRQSQQALAIAQAEISQKQLMMQLQKEIIEEKEDQVAERNGIISRLNAAVTEKSEELGRLSSALGMAEMQLTRAEGYQGWLGENLVGAHELYQALVLEVTQDGDTSRFKTLDPNVQQSIFAAGVQKYLESNKSFCVVQADSATNSESVSLPVGALTLRPKSSEY